MIKQIITYAASNGIQRGIAFIASLLLLRSYSSSEVGEYLLIQTIAQLMIPLATLNIAVALTREARVDLYRTVCLLRNISCYLFIAFLLISLIFLQVSSSRWIFVAIMLGLSEALYNVLVAFLMGRENSSSVLKISIVKTMIFTIFLMLSLFNFLSIINFVAFVAFLVILLCVCVIYVIALRVLKINRLKSRSHITYKTMYSYSIGTLPHTAALWISSSSDRAILGAMFGKEVVGQYAVAFTLGQCVMIFLAGVISALPPRIINDPKTWTIPTISINFIAKIAAISLLINVAMLFIFFINNKYFNFIPGSAVNDLITLSLVGSAYFISLHYVFYSSFLYQQRNTTALSTMGFGLLPFNLIVICVAVYFLGKIGAAAGLLMCYTSLSVAYAAAAVRLVPSLRETLIPIAVISGIQVISSLAIALLLLSIAS